MSGNFPRMSTALWSPADTVKIVAESLGINGLSEETSRTLAMDVEYRVHEILEEAIKFMRHSKRTVLCTSDINHSLRVLNVEPLYGYESTRPVKYKETLASNGQAIFYLDDDEVDFERIINAPLPRVPREVSFTAHWLAIEGVQPTIPQNPAISDIDSLPSSVRGSNINHSAILTNSYIDNNGNNNNNNKNNNKSNKSNNNNSTVENVEIKPLVKHVLSKELQLYFEKIVQSLIEDSNNIDEEKNINENNETNSLKLAALSSLRNDPGLHQLIPYFIQMVSEKTTNNLKNKKILITMLQVIDSLLSNKSIYIDPYIHSMMPAVLTLLLAKKLGSPPPSIDHYEIRDFAGTILKRICDSYGKSYHTLKPRVTRTLLRAFLDNDKPPGTHYGAIIGLQALGSQVIRVIILGNIKPWCDNILVEMPLQDQDLIIKALLQTFNTLIDDDSSFQSIADLTEDEIKKLNEKLGTFLAQKVLSQKNAEQYARAIIN